MSETHLRPFGRQLLSDRPGDGPVVRNSENHALFTGKQSHDSFLAAFDVFISERIPPLGEPQLSIQTAFGQRTETLSELQLASARPGTHHSREDGNTDLVGWNKLRAVPATQNRSQLTIAGTARSLFQPTENSRDRRRYFFL
jgi:hypothetical protein